MHEQPGPRERARREKLEAELRHLLTERLPALSGLTGEYDAAVARCRALLLYVRTYRYWSSAEVVWMSNQSRQVAYP